MRRKASEITKKLPLNKGKLSANSHKTPSQLRPGTKKRDQRFHSSKRRATERALRQEVVGTIQEFEFYEDLDIHPTSSDKHTLNEGRATVRKVA